jgi:DNA-binding MltR family transcriptional regulator
MKLADITTEDITTLVGLLTELQKDELIGKQYTDDSFYNPIQDINDNWVISTEEMLYTTNPETMWVKDLDLIVYEPKPTPTPYGI